MPTGNFLLDRDVGGYNLPGLPVSPPTLPFYSAHTNYGDTPHNAHLSVLSTLLYDSYRRASLVDSWRRAAGMAGGRKRVVRLPRADGLTVVPFLDRPDTVGCGQGLHMGGWVAHIAALFMTYSAWLGWVDARNTRLRVLPP